MGVFTQKFDLNSVSPFSFIPRQHSTQFSMTRARDHQKIKAQESGFFQCVNSLISLNLSRKYRFLKLESDKKRSIDLKKGQIHPRQRWSQVLVFCQGTRHELHPKVLEVIAGRHLTIFSPPKSQPKKFQESIEVFTKLLHAWGRQEEAELPDPITRTIWDGGHWNIEQQDGLLRILHQNSGAPWRDNKEADSIRALTRENVPTQSESTWLWGGATHSSGGITKGRKGA